MDPIIQPNPMFHSIGELFTFIGIIVSIGVIGVLAMWQLWKDIRGD